MGLGERCLGESTEDLGEATGELGDPTGDFGGPTGELKPPRDCFDTSLLSMAGNETIVREERSRGGGTTTTLAFHSKLKMRGLPLITGSNLQRSRVSARVR